MHEGRKNWKGRVSYMQLVSLHIFYRAPGIPAMGNGSYSRIDEQRQQQRRQYSFKEIRAFSRERRHRFEIPIRQYALGTRIICNGY